MKSEAEAGVGIALAPGTIGILWQMADGDSSIGWWRFQALREALFGRLFYLSYTAKLVFNGTLVVTSDHGPGVGKRSCSPKCRMLSLQVDYITSWGCHFP